MRMFVERMADEAVDLKQLGISDKTKEAILEQLMEIY